MIILNEDVALFSFFKDIESSVYNSKIVKSLEKTISEENARDVLSPGIQLAKDV